MSFTAECVDRWGRESKADVARYKASDAGLAEGGVAVGHYATAPMGRDYQADRDYLHYRGVPYSAIRPIAHTLAGQPIRVARVTKTPGGKSANGSRVRSVSMVEGMQSVHRARLHDGREVFMPRFIKEHAADLELYETHPVLDLLKNPNPIMTDWHLRCVTTASMELTAKSHWWYTKSRGRIVIWPLPTSWVTPLHNAGPFSGWRIYPGGSTMSKDVPTEEIIYFYYPDPSHLLGARSPIQAQQRAVHSDESMQDAQAALFENSIFPRYGVYTGNITDDEDDTGPMELTAIQREVIQGMIMQQHASALKTGTPIVFDKLIKDMKRLSNTVEEMDFLESGKLTYERITQAIGTPPYVMGATEPSSRAASAESRKHFADFSINPRAELQSKVMSKSLAPLVATEGEELLIWIEPYTPDDREERREDWKLLADKQSCNRNELRAGMLGLGPMKDGETIPAPPTTILVPAEPATRSIVPHEKAADDKQVNAWLKAHDRAEKRLVVTATNYFEAQRGDIQKRFRKLIRAHGGELTAVPIDQVMRDIFDAGGWDAKILEAFGPVIESLAFEGAAREWALHGKQALPIADLPANVQTAIQTELDGIRQRPYWQDINATTRGRLAKTLEEGIRAGESEYQLIVRIGDSPTVPGVTDGVLGSASNTVRAANIARTEGTMALNSGNYIAQEELIQEGLIQAREWNATADQYVRPDHWALHKVLSPSQTNPDGLFDVGGHRVPYPGHASLPAKQRVNCRCLVVAKI